MPSSARAVGVVVVVAGVIAGYALLARSPPGGGARAQREGEHDDGGEARLLADQT
jgi:hypothetical protein